MTGTGAAAGRVDGVWRGGGNRGCVRTGCTHGTLDGRGWLGSALASRYAAINALISAGNRAPDSRRCSASGGSGGHIPGRRRTYGRGSSKARQKHQAGSLVPKPRIGEERCWMPR